MKLMTILGTRPEIIRLSLVIPRLDRLCDHVLVHTGQNYHERLNDIFFKELGLRAPDYSFETKSLSAMVQIGAILENVEHIISRERPDRVLILGDTNSGLSAFVAKRMGVPVYHMEAGNRCYDDRVPEEVNRRVIDHSSDVLMPYTERSRDNLLSEGIHGDRIFVTGNPILEVLEHYGDEISKSEVLEELSLEPKGYFLATLHRAENVDDEQRMENFISAFNSLCERHDAKLVWSVHPRTKTRIESASNIRLDDHIILAEPFGLFDFVRLEKNAKCVLTDSGTVQEECCIFKVPNVTLRDTTERPETLEVGSNILSGCDPKRIVECVDMVIDGKREWTPPREYLVKNVSETVVRILLGYR
jgi:UDP-N-acetylglucosamine 2-epimerase (non-hydrolysing)